MGYTNLGERRSDQVAVTSLDKVEHASCERHAQNAGTHFRAGSYPYYGSSSRCGQRRSCKADEEKENCADFHDFCPPFQASPSDAEMMKGALS